ncbi:uncharacterized protein C2orf81 homolog isoform X2 [Myripristis murdjan]|uniref:Uncharacterized protein n=1 Tax=Myripristis murdjan TaxID=586833 RepID=A0A667YJ19_9TELE|nr:uncharacterized protein C2orf81 homolog isoform X2 [Myripristis murdjan]
MSRSAAKSHLEKTARRSSAQATTPRLQDAEVEEIIPGRLTQAQWMDMLRQEEAEDIVGEIMEDLLSRVMEGCFQAYIENQLAPFSISWAKACLVQVLEWQFLHRDEGEGPKEASRTEDSEPLPAITDPWAEGCVPVINITPPSHPAPQQDVAVNQVAGQTEPRANKQCQFIAQTRISPNQSVENKGPNKPTDHQSRRVLTPLPPLKSNHKKGRQIHKPSSSRTQKPPWSTSSSAERKDTATKSENTEHSPAVCTDRLESVPLRKEHRRLPKLNHACLPQHCVSPQYEIVDTRDTKPHSKRVSALSTSQQRLSQQRTESTVNSLKLSYNSMDQPAKLQGTNVADVRLSLWKKSSPTGQKRDRIVPFSGSVRLNKMDLAPGVSLVDPQVVQVNPVKLCPSTQSAQLRPMPSSAAVPLFSVEQLTTGPPPQVTPLFQP